VTGQTFAVLLSAAALGPLRGVLAELLYVAAGIAGLPVYSHGTHGYHALLGATGGYLAGFVLAALLVGAAARAGFDRRPATVVLAFLLGSAVIYLPGAGWLAHHAHLSAAAAIREGVTPYLVGDLAKALAAAVLLPTAWRAVCSVRRDPPTQ
jgi:biotin transport system substrate-specific component